MNSAYDLIALARFLLSGLGGCASLYSLNSTRRQAAALSRLERQVEALRFRLLPPKRIPARYAEHLSLMHANECYVFGGCSGSEDALFKWDQAVSYIGPDDYLVFAFGAPKCVQGSVMEPSAVQCNINFKGELLGHRQVHWGKWSCSSCKFST